MDHRRDTHSWIGLGIHHPRRQSDFIVNTFNLLDYNDDIRRARVTQKVLKPAGDADLTSVWVYSVSVKKKSIFSRRPNFFPRPANPLTRVFPRRLNLLEMRRIFSRHYFGVFSRGSNLLPEKEFSPVTIFGYFLEARIYSNVAEFAKWNRPRVFSVKCPEHKHIFTCQMPDNLKHFPITFYTL